MPKKLSEQQKRDMIDSFINGETIEHLAEKYKITKITITRHLKNDIEDKKFKDLVKNNSKKKSQTVLEKKIKIRN